MTWPSGPCNLKSACLCPYGQLRPRYKCIVCNRQLHHFNRGCSIQAVAGDDDKVLCKDGFGCQKKKKGKYIISAKARIAAEGARAAAAVAAAAALQDAVKPEEGPDGPTVPLPNLEAKATSKTKISVDIPEYRSSNVPLIVPPKPRRQYVGIEGAIMEDRKPSGIADDNQYDNDILNAEDAGGTTTDDEGVKKRAVYPGGKRRGIRKGAKLQSNKTLEDWYYACQTYEELRATTHPKLSHVDFLTSDLSNELFTGTLSERQSFGRYMTRYKQGTLQPLRVKRNKQRKYPDIEAKLIAYLDLRSNSGSDGTYPVDKKLSWNTLRQKCKEWAKEAGYTDFHVSPGWMDDTLKRHNRSTPGDLRTTGHKRSRRTDDSGQKEEEGNGNEGGAIVTPRGIKVGGRDGEKQGGTTSTNPQKSKRTVRRKQRPPPPLTGQAQVGGILAPTPLQALMQQQQQQQPLPQLQFPQEFVPPQMQFAPPQQFNFPIPPQQGGFTANFGQEQVQLPPQQGGFSNFVQPQQPQLQPQQLQQQQLSLMQQQQNFPNPQMQQMQDFQQQQQLLFQMQQASQQAAPMMPQQPQQHQQPQHTPPLQNFQQSAQQGTQNPFFRQHFGA